VPALTQTKELTHGQKCEYHAGTNCIFQKIIAKIRYRSPGQVNAPAKIDTTNTEGPIAAAAAEKSNHYGNLRPRESRRSLRISYRRLAHRWAYTAGFAVQRLIFVADEVRTRVNACGNSIMMAGLTIWPYRGRSARSSAINDSGRRRSAGG
jgi:hypothetical protein